MIKSLLAKPDSPKKKGSQGIFTREKNSDKNMNLPQKNLGKALNKLKEKESNYVSPFNVLDQHLNTESSERKSNSKAEKEISIILPSNPLNSNYNNYDRNNNPNNKNTKNTKKGNNNNYNNMEMISRSKDDIVIYPINTQKLSNNISNLHNEILKSHNKNIDKTFFNRNALNTSQQNLISEDKDDSLNGKVDKLIVDIKRDTSLKKSKQPNQKPNNKQTNKTTFKKHKLNTSVENPTFKSEDYFTNVVGNIKKNTEAIKGVSDKIMKLDPKRNNHKIDAVTKGESENISVMPRLLLKPKNKYGDSTNITNNSNLSKINEEKGNLDNFVKNIVKGAARAKEPSSTKRKNFNQALKDKINNSLFPGEQEFYFGNMLNTVSGTSGNSGSNQEVISRPNTISLKSSKNKKPEYGSSGTQDKSTKSTKVQDEFFNWDYGSKLRYNR